MLIFPSGEPAKFGISRLLTTITTLVHKYITTQLRFPSTASDVSELLNDYMVAAAGARSPTLPGNRNRGNRQKGRTFRARVAHARFSSPCRAIPNLSTYPQLRMCN